MEPMRQRERRYAGPRQVGAVVRRRGPLMTPERLGELGRLAVPDAAGHLAHGERPRGQELGRVAHADPGQVLAERRVADLGVGALELPARRGDAARDVVEREVGREVLLDDRDGLLEEAGPMADRRGALRGHIRHTREHAVRMNR
jgi:hypothetical protein